MAYLVSLSIFGSSSSYQTDNFLGADYQTDDNVATLNMEVVSVNPEENTLELLAIPSLSGELGQSLQTGSYVLKPLSFIFDAYSEQTRWSPNAGDIQAAMPMKLRLLGEVDSYPFDSYEAQLFSSVQDREGSETQSVGLLVHDNVEQIPGFAISSRQVAFLSSETTESAIENDRATGVANLKWQINRSTGVVLIVILMAALIVTGAVVSVFITVSILRGKRPPSINSLAWLAAFLFALFSVRAQLPGAPPSGIIFDVIVFYPAVLILVLLIAVNVSAWVVREDWDMENPVFAVRGKFPQGTHDVD